MSALMYPVNLHLRSVDAGREDPVGKVVGYSGRWIFHAWIRSEWRRRDINALGLSAAVVAWLERFAVGAIYLYDPGADVTHWTTVATLRALATRGHHAVYGETLNLPLPEWSHSPGAIETAYVPAARYVVVRAPSTESITAAREGVRTA